MPPRKQPEQRFPVRFTQAQRKVVAEIAPELAERMKLDERNQRTIEFTLVELKIIKTKAAGKVGKASTGMKRNSLRHVTDLTAQALDRFQGSGAIPAERLYQFKITMLDIQPAIWRRIQVKDGTLDKLHEHIQTATGWTNSHLHHFTIGDKEYGDPWLLDENFEEFDYGDSTTTKLSDILPRTGKRFRFEYEYDFGDSWRHEVLFEGCLRAEPGGRYPVCLEGARACPPEDVGGSWGYEKFVEAMAAPDHERHDEFMGWRGPFDPEAFDPVKATKRMKRAAGLALGKLDVARRASFHCEAQDQSRGAKRMASKDKERWERLAALGAKSEIPTPENPAPGAAQGQVAPPDQGAAERTAAPTV